MTMLKSLIASVLLTVGCGGSKKPPAEPAPAPTEPAPAEPAPPPTDPAPTPEAAKPAPPAPAPALATGAGKVKITGRGGMTIEVAIKADGTFAGMATNPKKGKKPAVKKSAGKLTERAAAFDGAESARLADDGTVTVLQGMKEIRDGKVVKDESKWEAVGVLDAAGVFTLAKDGSKVSFGDDGKGVGFPGDDMTLTFEGPPELRRTAIFLVVAMLAGGKTVMESGSATAPGNATAPVPAPPAKK